MGQGDHKGRPYKNVADVEENFTPVDVNDRVGASESE